MSEHLLDVAKVRAAFRHQRRHGVPESLEMTTIDQTRNLRLVQSRVHLPFSRRFFGVVLTGGFDGALRFFGGASETPVKRIAIGCEGEKLGISSRQRSQRVIRG